MVLKSRNTMVASAVVFLLVVILLRFAGGFFEDNIARVIGSIFGGSAESVPLLDFGSFDVSALNPASWSVDGFTSSVNSWLHEMIDSVLPAMINMVNIGTITVYLTRTKVLGLAAKAAPTIL